MTSSLSTHVLEWTAENVGNWLKEKGYGKYATLFYNHQIDGKALLLINENDLRTSPLDLTCLGDIKRLSCDIRQLKMESRQSLLDHGYDPTNLLFMPRIHSSSVLKSDVDHVMSHYHRTSYSQEMCNSEFEYPQSYPSSEDGYATNLRPEMLKAVIALIYLFIVTWITAFVMVIVHDRVPDMKRYPPLPDIVLDNVPHIPWAFHMCEWTGTLLLAIWLIVLLFHKHSDDSLLMEVLTKMKQAYVIWKGAGMSIQGVRTCGDYMFSGHTVALTMLNFFVTEYTPRWMYLLHTFTWLLNIFGVFFILSGHEHYSIDVFIAFYITSRLFLYYHTLANNQSLMQRDTGRTRIWFPLFAFFECEVDGIIPNEYESPLQLSKRLVSGVKYSGGSMFYLFYKKFLCTSSTSTRSAPMTAASGASSGLSQQKQNVATSTVNNNISSSSSSININKKNKRKLI